MCTNPANYPSLFRSALILIGILFPGQLKADDYFYVTIYGAQRPAVNMPRYTHTWATFVKLSGSGCDLSIYSVQRFSISWLPRTLEVRPLARHPEPGVNLTHDETVKWCGENRMDIQQLGPFQCDPRLWELASQRFAQLAEGNMLYKASDLVNLSSVRGGPQYCNCIYAVLDIDGRNEIFGPITMDFGDRSTRFVKRRLERFLVDPRQTRPDVNERAGLGNYPTVSLTSRLRR